MTHVGQMEPSLGFVLKEKHLLRGVSLEGAWNYARRERMAPAR